MAAQESPEFDGNRTTSLVIRGGQVKKKKPTKADKAFGAWQLYIKDESLEENWQRFLHDLNLGDFKSKTQCKKKLKNVWINIVDFLAAVKARNIAAEKIKDDQDRAAAMEAPVEVKFFVSQAALANYTIQTRKIFPRHRIEMGSPLKLLLADILRHGR